MNRGHLHRRNFLLHLQERPGYEQPILLKEAAREPSSRSDLDQLRNEYAITQQLIDVAGVRPVYTKEGTESQPVLLLEYIPGRSLAELIRSASLDLSEKLRLAVDVARVLSCIHEQQVMHKDINPSNILVAEHGGVYIIDFGIATTLQQESPARLATGDTLVGTLAYISPEQTGRMNRPVDYRTDLYSLGVTLYELFTGQLPFQGGDALEIIHSHIARQPAPPCEINAGIPCPLSDIILKLLAKNAEDRYQTAQGLQIDLQHCLDQYQATGRIEPFESGCDDFTGRLQIPAKLYGREIEIAQLLETFERTAQGRAELLLVAGYAGVGKTSLVHEIHKPITAKRGYFVEGKFDQYQRSIPYAAWVQAFSELVNSWLAERETDIDQWRAAILEAVGQNGQVLIDVISNLELVIGPQPVVPELGGLEAQNRFNYLFQRFIKALATPDHPLVVFLDDLQWIDLASLNLLKTLLIDADSGHFLVIGAYRANEVDATHSLMLGLRDLKEAGGTVNRLTLGNLGQADINQLLSDSLHIPSEQCLSLAQLIHAKTGGNAFFSHQLLNLLEDDGWLSFDQQDRAWQWDMAELELLTVSDNVVELMVNKVQRLPAATQEALKMAACLGTQFEAEMLNLASGLPPEATQAALGAAYQEGLLVQYKGHSRFAHDRIQQAAYSLIPDAELAPLHRRIGRTLLRETPPQARDERLFDLVGHLNKGAALVETEAERVELAKLNLKASKIALSATAFAAAQAYSQNGIGLLAANGWQVHYPLTLTLHQLAAEAAYLNVDLGQSERHIATILAEAHSLLDRVPAYIVKIRVHNARYEMDEVMDIGLTVLDELGFSLAESLPPDLSVQAVSELQPMTDPPAQAAMELLDNLVATAWMARPDLFPSIVFTSMHLTLEFGLHPPSCSTVCFVGMLTGLQDIEAAFQWGRLALQLVDRLKAPNYLGQVKPVFDVFIRPWKTDYRQAEREILSSIQLSLEQGKKNHAASALSNAAYLAVIAGHPLDQAQEKMRQYMQLMQSTGEAYALHNIPVWRQFVANLRGLSDDPASLEGAFFSETRELPLTQAANIDVPAYFSYLLKLVIHYHLGDHLSAYANSIEAEQLVHMMRSHVTVPFLIFYQSLVILRLPDAQRQQPDVSEKLVKNLQKLQLWAQHAPLNHQHKVDLILAEQARVERNSDKAMDHYEAAIAGARENEFIQEEALANELYARFWLAKGKDRFARQFMREAHALYERWGAAAITAYLAGQYPQWLTVVALDIAPVHPETVTAKFQDSLDLLSILKASQAIAAELELDKLLGKMITITMENGGAQRGFLILEREGQWLIEAAAEVGQAQPQVMQAINIADNDLLSQGIVRYVARTRQAVVLANAAHSGEFVGDPYIRRHQVKSLLCTPLVNWGKTSGILYLENNLTSNVFTWERVDLLGLLSSQVAISLDHARLYARSEEKVEERTQALSIAESQIRILFENTPLGIGLATLEGYLLAANQALLRMTGYTETEALQLNVSTIYDDPAQRAVMLQQLQAEQSVRDFGVRLKRKDGTTFFASLNASAIRRADQDILLAIIEDVTAEVQAEATLTKANADLKTLLDSAKSITAALQLDRLLEVILDHLDQVVDYSGAAIWIREEDSLVIRANRAPEGAESAVGTRVTLAASPTVRQMIETREAFIVDDISKPGDLVQGVKEVFEPLFEYYEQTETSWLGVPLLAKDRVIGVISLVSDQPGHYTRPMADLVQALANQAAIAIENARLHRQVQRTATLEERARLARELHDAVTQTLFSASLLADTTPHIWDKDQAIARQNLNHLGRLLRGALAEMRTLLFELRPATMQNQTLGRLLGPLAEAARARTRAIVLLNVEGDRTLPEEVTLALLRIAQESLNNIAKHAEATEVKLNLVCGPERVVLDIADDGRGFDVETIPAGHYGLSIMRERAQKIGAMIQIDSKIGRGTQVYVAWSDFGEAQL